MQAAGQLSTSSKRSPSVSRGAEVASSGPLGPKRPPKPSGRAAFCRCTAESRGRGSRHPHRRLQGLAAHVGAHLCWWSCRLSGFAILCAACLVALAAASALQAHCVDVLKHDDSPAAVQKHAHPGLVTSSASICQRHGLGCEYSCWGRGSADAEGLQAGRQLQDG